MKAPRWLLPAAPDVLGLLESQLALTQAGADAFAAWAAGDTAAADTVRRIEHEADDAKRALQRALRQALVTPLEPEDVFSLSQSVDWLLDDAKDTIRESDITACPPDAALAEMARHVATGVRHLSEAVAALGRQPDAATPAAEAAIKETRRLEHAYRSGMGGLLAEEDVRTVIARRELYRRCSRMGKTVVDVAERVVYATFKIS